VAVKPALLLGLLVLSIVACGERTAPTISPADLYERTTSAAAPLVLDVRTPEEYRTGHVPGAVNIPHTELASRVGELRTENEVVLYCMIGPRARLGERILIDAGVENVLHLEGGLAAWRESGLSVEGGP
jgi:rhodanese-related sulfurtransferase